MNNLEMSIFAIAMSLSVGASAGGNTDSTVGNDRNLDRQNGRDAILTQDCSGKTGSDRVKCDKDLLNNKNNNMSDENTRLNRDRDSRIQNNNNRNSGIKNNTDSMDSSNTEMQSPNARTRNTTSPDPRLKDMRPNDSESRKPNAGNTGTSNSGSSK